MAVPADVRAVAALLNKAIDLGHAGHRARAKDYERRALVAAQARGIDDCLIVARLQRYQANTLFRIACEATEAEPLSLAPAFALFFAAAATVQRRMAAGTLLPGSCRAAETAWSRLINEHMAEFVHTSFVKAAAPEIAAETAESAQLMGYETYVDTAILAADVLAMYTMSLTQEQQRVCVVLMADAVDLFMLPRICEDISLGIEGEFVRVMQDKLIILSQFLVLTGGDEGARLLESWQRLKQSGVLQRRRVAAAIQTNEHF